MTNIKSLRKEMGLSQQELAERVGVDQTSISCWELDKCLPNTDKLLALAEVFNVSTDYVLGVSQYHFPVNVGRDNMFTFEELKIIEDYRSLPQDVQQTVKQTLTAFVAAQKIK